jgi:protein SCO1/2
MIEMRLKAGPYLFTLIVVTALALVAWLVIARFWPHRYHGFALEPTRPVADFTLIGPNNQPVKLSDFRGKLTVLYFGYTFCPDVCPTTLAELAQGLKRMGRQADKVQVAMITVDPERDTPELLAQYMAHFDARFIGLSGTAEQIAAAATPLGIYYERHEGTAATGYLVDHTATVAVIDQNGYLRLVFPYGTPGEDIASDLAQLLK